LILFFSSFYLLISKIPICGQAISLLPLLQSCLHQEFLLVCLFFAAALPDFLFFTNAMLGIEQINLAKDLPGVFPYRAVYPYTHTLLGIAFLGACVGGLQYYFNKSRREAAVFFLCVLSHFFLELPGHRKDIGIIPFVPPFYGAGWFDSKLATFLGEALLVFPLYQYYLGSSRSVYGKQQESDQWSKTLGAILAIQHLFFCFGSIPSDNARFVHSIAFNFLVLITCWVGDRLDKTRVITIDKIPGTNISPRSESVRTQ